MKQAELKGKVQTVLGMIEPSEMGITLPHEHLICDATTWHYAPDEATFRGERIKLLDVATAETPASSAEPGSLERKGSRLFVACGEGTALELLRVQLPGKQPITGADFANGYRISEGERLG